MARGSNRVTTRRNNAIKEMDLMHKAMDEGDIKKAKHHKILANVAVDKLLRA